MFLVYKVIYNLLLLTLIASFLFVWIRMMVQLFSKHKEAQTRPKFPKIALAVLLFSIAGVGSLTYFMCAQARARISQRLETLSFSYTVMINGKPAADPNSIIAALQFADIEAHHSHPTTQLEVQIEDQKGRLTLILARDSQRASEYWVYSPQDDFTKGLTTGHEVGRIDTEVFNNY
jgi:hypothetical protein